jgi:uncharacterized phage protein (TIGR01671 family)
MRKREIKFRAWDGKRMLNNVGFHPSLLKSLAGDPDYGYKEDDEGAYIICPQFANYFLMQFTGLKDRNGKDIYEGDILKSKNHTVIVKFHRFGFKFFTERGGMWSCSAVNSLSVIGNFYENQELIKQF